MISWPGRSGCGRCPRSCRPSRRTRASVVLVRAHVGEVLRAGSACSRGSGGSRCPATASGYVGGDLRAVARSKQPNSPKTTHDARSPRRRPARAPNPRIAPTLTSLSSWPAPGFSRSRRSAICRGARRPWLVSRPRRVALDDPAERLVESGSCTGRIARPRSCQTKPPTQIAAEPPAAAAMSSQLHARSPCWCERRDDQPEQVDQPHHQHEDRDPQQQLRAAA